MFNLRTLIMIIMINIFKLLVRYLEELLNEDEQKLLL